MQTVPALLIVAPLAAAAAPICLPTYQIDHTTVVDDQTILFAMRDRTVYRNRLPAKCPGLYLDNRGFTYSPVPGSNEVCSNLVIITLNTTHAVCQLGAFEPLPKGTKG